MIVSLPQIDPSAFSLGPLVVRWYSLAYIAGILSALFCLKKINQREKFLTQEAYDNWIVWAVLSILLGGRIGYVLFYNLPYFLSHPFEIIAFWHGGMSFHGGLCGVIFGMWFFARKYQIRFLQLMDVLALATPVGLFFGRLANFMNMELYGRITDSNFGVIFPNAGDLPRHPSQLYEAFLEGIILFAILFLIVRFTKISKSHGVISGIFLTLYGIFRFLIENFREPDEQIGFLFAKITTGQILSLPLILIGTFLILLHAKKKKFLA
ncbi:MAG: prolipoprotein diacylglyceryl transferase [Alphaproteobacteria bacterium RIFCSPLOWO2_01_FULL_40_26]|nr:MAG: prolipoprotein diacylglyceryl transferase [Alphaproteobacteria bacterium RIFCSPHIGHO2_02_FULL_40_34]OFW88631.1 MAG: prolipoprotein diacylglyceryl transferase [Alphaproteobacteria bacterium RIFCSPHIGHO2_01_FULL_40_8]OFW95466.1 MAG: prolipoprotein diacylglyceryl transferase [Alphaproteobacteria bacterium RIFCSPLOWO2_01_FULL_40_26]OFX10272.1 MAG: prolipoprotein diacylglyceryl transferase [Alphaproteobacteria bacterium RIFCSPLOWO2_02_FULL_40_19]OFX11524.1 MAG: prolipoprotein diacylglyceryl 